MRTTILSCTVMAVIAMAIGLSIYGSTLTQNYVASAYNIADNASTSIRRGQPRTPGLVSQVMGIYNSLTPEQQLKMISDDPAERSEYRSFFASIDTALHTGSIYDILFHMLPGFKNNVDYVYLGMYDAENSRLVFIVDPDEDESDRRYPGDWEAVTEEEAQRFLAWEDKKGQDNLLYTFSRSDSDGWLYTAGHPVVNDDGEIIYFMLVDVKLTRIVNDMLNYALKVGMPLLLK